MDINEVILSELRDLRKTVDELAADSKQRISTLEAKTKPLFDNGVPGRCSKMEVRVTSLEHWRIHVAAIAATVSAIVAVAVKFLL